MGYSYLLTPKAPSVAFRATYGILEDVDIAYFHEGDITLRRCAGSNVAFFPLMAILEGGLRFPIDPFIIGTLKFYGFCPDQLPPNFYEWLVVLVD